MEPSTKVDPERALERTGDELEERLGRLDEHIGDARQAAQSRREEADPAAQAAGDWEDTDDDSGGDDPATFDDPDQLEDPDEVQDEDEDEE